jgi:DNA repair photolyase
MNWKKIQIINDSGEEVDAHAPVIVSASRSTDIPAFYADWFVNRWQKGYVRWKNPFNGLYSYVSFQNTRAVVFWSKNPRPMLKHIGFLDDNIKNYYFQFSINDYREEGFEKNVPNLEKRIDTFKILSEKIGREKVIWRFDPLLLTDKIDVPELFERVKNIGDQLQNHTNKLVFSYADIKVYSKVAANLKKERVPYREFSSESMIEFAKGLQKLNKTWGFELATCAEIVPLEKYGIQHNKCIDDDLLIRLFSHDAKLMDFLGVEFVQLGLFGASQEVVKQRNLKDKGQRELCGCIVSKDIGQYNTCPHECIYCYANTSKDAAMSNFKTHKANPLVDTITGLK